MFSYFFKNHAIKNINNFKSANPKKIMVKTLRDFVLFENGKIILNKEIKKQKFISKKGELYRIVHSDNKFSLFIHRPKIIIEYTKEIKLLTTYCERDYVDINNHLNDRLIC